MNILLVEDDITLAMGIEYSLKNEGFNVYTVGKIKDAKEKISNSHIDIILLDVNLPDGNGYELCKEVRVDSEVPIIFLTACDEEVNIVMGLDLGADDYITKPFSFNLLIKRVEAVLRRSTKSNSEETLHFEDLNLNLNTYTVEVDGETIELTLKEFNILKTLIEKYPQVITRENLLDSIWGYDYYGDTRIVDAHIKNLRKKIKLQYIKTVKGIGYTLEKSI